MEIKIFRITAGKPFLITKGMKKFWEELKVEPFDEKV
jgi:hypothetical protein